MDLCLTVLSVDLQATDRLATVNVPSTAGVIHQPVFKTSN